LSEYLEKSKRGGLPMADTLYKCQKCGLIQETKDGKRPEVCQKCGSKDIVSVSQQTGQFGCVGIG
jgi:DNA-directed RNA polymerase subunit RPC12/RpoP